MRGKIILIILKKNMNVFSALCRVIVTNLHNKEFVMVILFLPPTNLVVKVMFSAMFVHHTGPRP